MKKICENCNKEYNAKKSKQKYCCLDCRREAMVTKIEEKICPYCNNKFIPKDYRESQKYCSLECKNNDKKAIKYNKVCPQCGKEFIVSATYKNNKHCSKECASKSLENKIIINCKNCGQEKEIFPSQLNNNNGNFCSKKCSYEYLTKIEFFKGENNPKYNSISTNCGWCGKELSIIKSVFDKNEFNYCSKECMASHYEIRFSGKNSPTWKGGKCKRFQYGSTWFSARRNARKRDEYVCQLCGKTEKDNEEQLSVHHITPFRTFSSYLEANKLDNLVCLCRRCHDFVHSSSNIDKIYLND